MCMGKKLSRGRRRTEAAFAVVSAMGVSIGVVLVVACTSSLGHLIARHFFPNRWQSPHYGTQHARLISASGLTSHPTREHAWMGRCLEVLNLAGQVAAVGTALFSRILGRSQASYASLALLAGCLLLFAVDSGSAALLARSDVC